jgi:enamine deaminase RidA (YjgF/YER057c/UK114 family)
MAGEIEARLKTLGIYLPAPGAPAANYVPFVVTGNLLFISGQVPMTPEGVKFVGKLGREFSVEEGQQAARICAINVLGVAKAAVGDLDRIQRMVKVVGFVNGVPDFQDAHKVINGASDLITEVLGDARGKHARSAIGMGSLPLGVAVEVEAIAEIA